MQRWRRIAKKSMPVTIDVSDMLSGLVAIDPSAIEKRPTSDDWSPVISMDMLMSIIDSCNANENWSIDCDVTVRRHGVQVKCVVGRYIVMESMSCPGYFSEGLDYSRHMNWLEKKCPYIRHAEFGAEVYLTVFVEDCELALECVRTCNDSKDFGNILDLERLARWLVDIGQLDALTCAHHTSMRPNGKKVIAGTVKLNAQTTREELERILRWTGVCGLHIRGTGTFRPSLLDNELQVSCGT